jgi:hypothetical protein
VKKSAWSFGSSITGLQNKHLDWWIIGGSNEPVCFGLSTVDATNFMLQDYIGAAICSYRLQQAYLMLETLGAKS